MSNYTCFVGCSYTAGSGFKQEKFDPDFWPVLLHNNVSELTATEYVNLGIGGASNETIFSTAINAILDFNPKYIIVQWSSYPRAQLLLGLETYPATQLFSWDAELLDHNLHAVSYSSEYLTNIRNRFLSLEHPHNQIKNIVCYTNTLIKLADKVRSKIFFVNGLCDWDHNYFNKLENVLPDRYTEYTKKILDTETRNDNEIFTLYNLIHNDYQTLGGIHENLWLNLYNSLRHNQIDTNSDNRHPGKNSNQIFYNFLSQSLQQKLSS